jgi:hypothetical protein
MKPLRKIISDRKKAFKNASPKTRDRLRQAYKVALVAAQLRRESAA